MAKKIKNSAITESIEDVIVATAQEPESNIVEEVITEPIAAPIEEVVKEEAPVIEVTKEDICKAPVEETVTESKKVAQSVKEEVLKTQKPHNINPYNVIEMKVAKTSKRKNTNAKIKFDGYTWNGAFID